jgi:hypothetical protein
LSTRKVERIEEKQRKLEAKSPGLLCKSTKNAKTWGKTQNSLDLNPEKSTKTLAVSHEPVETHPNSQFPSSVSLANPRKSKAFPFTVPCS